MGSQLLKSLGYAVITANSGNEAIRIYKEKQHEIDMVILDMIMPQMGGEDVFDRLKEMNSNVRVLLSSGYSLNGQAKMILDRGCDGFIQKPFTIDELSRKLIELRK